VVKVRKIRRPDDVSLGVDGDAPATESYTDRGTSRAGPSRSRTRSASPNRHHQEESSQNQPAVDGPASPRRPTEAVPNPTPRPPAPLPVRYRKSNLAPSRTAHPPLLPCRSVYSYTRLNHIEEGTYGVVFRARCNDTNQIFALKKLKLEEEKQGFPITSLREIMALMVAGDHPNVVGIREIVVGETLNQCVSSLF
jgi:cell division cycle 2-like protein